MVALGLELRDLGLDLILGEAERMRVELEAVLGELPGVLGRELLRLLPALVLHRELDQVGVPLGVDARGLEKLPHGEPLDADRIDGALRDVRHAGELRLGLGDTLGLLVDGRVLCSGERGGEVLAGEQHLRGGFVERGLPEREEHRGSRSEHEGGQNDPLVPQNDAEVVP